MTKIIVTGGSGFIGHHLVKRLEENHEVHSLDLPSFDVRQTDSVRQSFDEVKPEVVFHLAGLLGTSELFDISQKTVIETNILGTVNVIYACLRHDARLIYSSMPRLWLNPYSITKTAAQDYIESFGMYYNLKHTNLVISNAYGPGQKMVHYEKIIPTFITRALKDEPIIINGKGKQCIDMIYIDDVIEAFCCTLSSKESVGKTIQIGSGNSFSVNNIASSIKGMTDSSSTVVHREDRKGEIPGTIQVVDVREAERVLGFRAMMPFDIGLAKTIEYYRKELGLK